MKANARGHFRPVRSLLDGGLALMARVSSGPLLVRDSPPAITAIMASADPDWIWPQTPSSACPSQPPYAEAQPRLAHLV